VRGASEDWGSLYWGLVGTDWVDPDPWTVVRIRADGLAEVLGRPGPVDVADLNFIRSLFRFEPDCTPPWRPSVPPALDGEGGAA